MLGTSRMMYSWSQSFASFPPTVGGHFAPVPLVKVSVNSVPMAGVGLVKETAIGKKSQMPPSSTDIPATACLDSACDAPSALDAKRMLVEVDWVVTRTN